MYQFAFNTYEEGIFNLDSGSGSENIFKIRNFNEPWNAYYLFNFLLGIILRPEVFLFRG